jgi:hypothetical protein
METILGERATEQIKIICSSIRQSDGTAGGSARAWLERGESITVKPTVALQRTLSSEHKDVFRKWIIDQFSVVLSIVLYSGMDEVYAVRHFVAMTPILGLLLIMCFASC